MSVAARDNSRFMKHVKSFAASRPSGREQTNRGFCEIMLTDSSPFAVAVSFVSDLLKDWPDILASAALCLDAEGFRWRGAPENSVGALPFDRLESLQPRHSEAAVFARRRADLQRCLAHGSFASRPPSRRSPARPVSPSTRARLDRYARPRGSLSP